MSYSVSTSTSLIDTSSIRDGIERQGVLVHIVQKQIILSTFDLLQVEAAKNSLT